MGMLQAEYVDKKKEFSRKAAKFAKKKNIHKAKTAWRALRLCESICHFTLTRTPRAKTIIFCFILLNFAFLVISVSLCDYFL
jgi:hypothetical protein